MIEKPNEKSEANGILQPLNDRHVLRPQVITVAMRYKRNILLGLHVGWLAGLSEKNHRYYYA